MAKPARLLLLTTVQLFWLLGFGCLWIVWLIRQMAAATIERPRPLAEPPLVLGGGAQPATTKGYLSWPAVCGAQLVFVSEGDLWACELPAADGPVQHPRRLTNGRGRSATYPHPSSVLSEHFCDGVCSLFCLPPRASRPSFSRDGSLLAFSLEEDGYQEVYACPSAGGRAKRLTYLGADEAEVVGWIPAGEACGEVVFATTAKQDIPGTFGLWSVAVDSCAPAPLGLGRGANWMARFPAAGPAAVVIGRHTGDPAVDEWKRYVGGRCGQLWVDRAGGSEFEQLKPLPAPGNIGRGVLEQSRTNAVDNGSSVPAA